MKAINLVIVLSLFMLTGCFSTPYGVRGQGQKQSPYDFAVEQSREMRDKGSEFVDNVLNEVNPCTGVAEGTPAVIFSNAEIKDRNGAVSFRMSKSGKNVGKGSRIGDCVKSLPNQ